MGHLLEENFFTMFFDVDIVLEFHDGLAGLGALFLGGLGADRNVRGDLFQVLDGFVSLVVACLEVMEFVLVGER